MKAVTVDASVWIAAQDKGDPFSEASRAFLSAAVASQVEIHVPAYAKVEVACALARKLRNAAKGRRLAHLVLTAANASEQPVDAELLNQTLVTGTDKFLRGADALYAACAELTKSELISWDKEHVERGGGGHSTQLDGNAFLNYKG